MSLNVANDNVALAWIPALLGLVLCFITHRSQAMPDDHTKTMQFKAGAADIDQQSHHGTYTGNIELDQGTTHIRAAKATTEGNEKNQLVKAVIEGEGPTQAHYWTLTTLDKPPLHAYADIIYYHPDRHLIELVGHARVEQGEDSFSAPQISYDTLHQHVISKSDGKTRTTIVIHPKKGGPQP